MNNHELPSSSRTRVTRRISKSRLPQLDFMRSNIMLDPPETIGLSIALLLLLLAVFSHFYFLRPARERLRAVQASLMSELSLLQASGQGLQEGASNQATVAEIITSLREFETNHLPLQSEGQIAVVEELNTIIARNNLRYDGISYAALDAIAAAPSSSGARSSAGGANARLQSIFPGFGLTVSVEGAYPNVRRFIHDLETSRQFLIINSVELEGVKSAGAGGSITLVNLNLNIAAYFRPIETTSAVTNESSAPARAATTRAR